MDLNGVFSFVAGALPLLGAPGPTNTVLAASGATAGFRRSAPLVAASSLGYLVTVSALSLLVVPLTLHSVLFRPILSICSALYIASIAWAMWTEPPPPPTRRAPGFGRVLMATLTNPKALIVAFVLIPRQPEGPTLAGLAPFITTLIALAITTGAAWIAAGTLARQRLSGLNESTIGKTSSIILLGFATALLITGISQAATSIG